MIKIHKIAVFGFWFLIFITLFTWYLPGSVLKVDTFFSSKIINLLPQGWGFFTKEPKEQLFDAYKIQNGNLIQLSIKNASRENYFGFSRKSRFIGFEISKISAKINHESWVQSKGNIKIPKSFKIQYVRGNFRYFKRNNLYILIKTNPIPWAWASYSQEPVRPFEYVIISIKS
jgi:antimicrobial peptide system SdpA family protein